MLRESRLWVPLSMLWLTLITLVILQWLLALLSNWLVVVFTALIAIPIGMFRFQLSRRYREAVLDAYFEEASLYRRLCRGRPMVAIFSGLSSVVLAAILMVALANILPPYFWLTLLLWAPVWIFLLRVIEKPGNSQIKELHRMYFKLKFVGWLSAGFLVLILMAVSLYVPVVDLSGQSFEEAIRNSPSAGPAMRSQWLALLVELWRFVETLKLWSLQNAIESGVGARLIILAWFIALAQQALVVVPILALFQAVHAGYLNWADHRDYQPENLRPAEEAGYGK